jgi:hypothetical protein
VTLFVFVFVVSLFPTVVAVVAAAAAATPGLDLGRGGDMSDLRND